MLFEYFCECFYSLSVLRHRTIDIIRHTEYDRLGISFFYEFFEFWYEIPRLYSLEGKCKTLDRVGESALMGTVIEREIII